MNEDSDAAAQAELDALERVAASVATEISEHLRQLMVACDAVARDVVIEGKDHFGFMAVQFNAKQIHHAEALLLLQDHGDSSLVARSMLEGMCLLKWAQKYPEQAHRWRMYLAVVTMRMEMESDGEAPRASSITDDESIPAALDLFLTDRARALRDEGKPLPSDPWASRWYRPQLRQIFEDVGELRSYEVSYAVMSDWHHWAPSGLARSLSMSPGEMRFSPRSRAQQLGALGTAFHCLATTGFLVGEHFRRGEVAGVTAAVSSFANDLRVQNAYRGKNAP